MTGYRQPLFVNAPRFTSNWERKSLILILVIATSLRLYLCFFSGLPHIHRDSVDYFNQADEILNGGYINYFPNGYPFLIAGVKALFQKNTEFVLLLLGLLFSVGNVYLSYRISKQVFQLAAPALMAAFVVAVFPSQINYTRWLTTEVPTAFLLLLGYYLLFHQRYFLSGLFLGLATAVRTDEAPVFVLLIFVAWFWKRKFSWVFLVSFLAPLVLIGTYCYLKTGQFSIAGHSQINIMYSITSSGSNIDWYYQDKHPEVNSTGKAVKMYWEYIVDNPGQFFRDKLVNLWELWGFFPSSDHGNRSLFARAVMGIGNFFMIFFGLAGWWINRKNYFAFLLIIPFLVVTPLHTLLVALPRYTYPVEPFMLILASWSAWRICKRYFYPNWVRTHFPTPQ